MSAIQLNCTNQNCNQSLSFQAEQKGTIQECNHCGQKILVPGERSTEVKEYSHQPPQVAQRPEIFYGSGPVRSLKRDDSGRKTRKIKMGSGCLAMFAVMFAVIILGVGFNLIIDIEEKGLGFFTMLAGLGGIAAFVYFGYWATETEDRFQDRRRH